jgi:hypothetical protein
MRPLLPLLLVLLAGPAAAQKSGAAIRCKEDHIACKEDCTIEFGGSSRTYNKLGTCLQKCENTFGVCKERHFSLQQNNIEPSQAYSPPPPPEEPPSTSSASNLDEEAAPSKRQGVYRASEATPKAPEPEDEELEPLEETAPAPPPKAKPKEPAQEPPPPKKKDLSEWD